MGWWMNEWIDDRRSTILVKQDKRFLSKWWNSLLPSPPPRNSSYLIWGTLLLFSLRYCRGNICTVYDQYPRCWGQSTSTQGHHQVRTEKEEEEEEGCSIPFFLLHLLSMKTHNFEYMKHNVFNSSNYTSITSHMLSLCTWMQYREPRMGNKDLSVSSFRQMCGRAG